MNTGQAHPAAAGPVNLKLARFPQDLATVVDIFREYVLSPTVDLGFQNFEAEFAALPGAYAQPEGCVLLAWAGDQVLGCAAVRRVGNDAAKCELKRVYVRPAGRGLGLGRALVVDLLDWARQAGYQRMYLDVLPEFVAAQGLYASLGFVASDPISHNPVAGTQFLALDL